jgi:hypothetical protein
MSQDPIIPPTTGLTEEAAAALGLTPEETNPELAGIVSGADDNGSSGPFFQTFTASAPIPDGDAIDAANEVRREDIDAPADRARRRRRETDSDGAREAKAGPPSLDEWVKFFSRVVLRVGTEFYITMAFKGIEEDALTDRDIERLDMTDEERSLIAVPFAELSHKSKLMRKHGRMIVASGDALNAVVVLGMWMSRVQRVAAKYRPKQPRSRVTLNGSSGQGTETPVFTEGSQGGRFPPGFTGPFIPGPG